MAIKVRRGGRVLRDWSDEGTAEVHSDRQTKQAVIDFLVQAAGNGMTRIEVRIDADSFRDLAMAMTVADPDAAVAAFRSML